MSRSDGFLTATITDENGEKEYIIQDFQRAQTCANMDDSTLYWTLNLCECGNGNLKI